VEGVRVRVATASPAVLEQDLRVAWEWGPREEVPSVSQLAKAAVPVAAEALCWALQTALGVVPQLVVWAAVPPALQTVARPASPLAPPKGLVVEPPVSVRRTWDTAIPRSSLTSINDH
jgi:hypothetical protein